MSRAVSELEDAYIHRLGNETDQSIETANGISLMNNVDEIVDEDARDVKWFEPSPDWVNIHQRDNYATYSKDLGYMWHWILVKDGEIIQEGGSISFHTAKRTLEHVLEYFASRNLSAIA